MKSEFGKKIEKLQLINGVSAGELAKKVGISRAGIYQLKKSKKPHIITIHKIAKAFDVDPGAFVD